MTGRVLLLSCEHGGTRVPAAYRHLFRSQAARSALEGHRGCDLGALRLARALARALGAPLFASTVTRLLVDLNRSIGHPDLFSEFSRSLTRVERERLLDRHYLPHRDAIESWIADRAQKERAVLHLGVHSFTPRIGPERRTADLGLLYDPSRQAERILCGRWKAALAKTDAALVVRRNYPYLGKADGLVTHLRRRFDEAAYVGVELEANQALLATKRGQDRAAAALKSSIRSL